MFDSITFTKENYLTMLKDIRDTIDEKHQKRDAEIAAWKRDVEFLREKIDHNMDKAYQHCVMTKDAYNYDPEDFVHPVKFEQKKSEKQSIFAAIFNKISFEKVCVIDTFEEFKTKNIGDEIDFKTYINSRLICIKTAGMFKTADHNWLFNPYSYKNIDEAIKAVEDKPAATITISEYEFNKMILLKDQVA